MLPYAVCLILLFKKKTNILQDFQICISVPLNKNKLRKNCWENHQVKSMMPDISFLVVTHIYQVCQNFGTCTGPHTAILWQLSNPRGGGTLLVKNGKRQL